MIKLLVFMDRVHTKGVEARCYVFEFQTSTAANQAASFFEKRGYCRTEIVADKA